MCIMQQSSQFLEMDSEMSLHFLFWVPYVSDLHVSSISVIFPCWVSTSHLMHPTWIFAVRTDYHDDKACFREQQTGKNKEGVMVNKTNFITFRQKLISDQSVKGYIENWYLIWGTFVFEANIWNNKFLWYCSWGIFRSLH